MKVFLLISLLSFVTANSFSQLSEKHNIYYYGDTVIAKQINEYSVRYDKNNNPLDTIIHFQIIFSHSGQLYEIRSKFQQGLYYSKFYDTIYPFKYKSYNNPFTPESPIPKTGVSAHLSSEIIEYNEKEQIISHIFKYRDLDKKRIFYLYDKSYRLLERKTYWNLKLTSSYHIEYIK